MYVLTEEGKEYLKGGLPEEQLLKKVKKERAIKDLDLPHLDVAIQWAKKNKWIEVKKGNVKVKKKGKSPLKKALKRVKRGKEPSEKRAKVLLQRNLIEEVKEGVVKKAKDQLEEGVNHLTPELIKTGLWKKAKFKSYNVEARGKEIHPGKKHPYQAFLDSVKDDLVKLGFQEMEGPLVELEFWNFDALFQPQHHAARDWTETYQLKNPKKGKLPDKEIVDRVKAAHENGWETGSTGWGYGWSKEKASRLMVRAHDTAISPRYLSGFSGEIEIPGKYFSLVRCARPDVIDATHSVEFNQMGGFVVDKSLNFRSLLGLLKMFAFEIGGAEEIRFFPDYYPFTEPSVQLSAKHPKLGWIELAGAGMFREELTRPLGVDVPVIAWGIGIDRLAMFKLGVKDIRELFSNDLKWLRDKECQQ